ncbi:MAG TPA: DinB family protein [Cytophagaceae bacterium]|jgi:hypothetical protein
MSPSQAFLNIQEQDHFWVKVLEKHTLAELNHKPSEEEWSIGQLLNHLIFINQTLLKQIEICVEKQGIYDTKSPKLGSAVILFFNRLPPMKFKVPKVIDKIPAQPSNKEELHQKFKNILAAASAIAEKVKSASPHYKVVHPSMGALSAKEWLQFMSIHMKHHRRQYSKLKELLKNESSQPARKFKQMA